MVNVKVAKNEKLTGISSYFEPILISIAKGANKISRMLLKIIYQLLTAKPKWIRNFNLKVKVTNTLLQKVKNKDFR